MKPKYFLLAILFVLMILPIGKAWYNTDWLNRQEIIINGTNNLIKNPVYLLNSSVFDTASLISSGLLNTDCSDLLLINSSDDSIMTYAFENFNDLNYGCNTAKSIIWVKPSQVTTGNVTNAYLYHNNPTATDHQSSFQNVFSNFYSLLLFGDSTQTILSQNYVNPSLNATLQGTVTYKELIGNALNFTGGGTTGTRLNTTYVDFNKTSNFTIGFWIDYIAWDRTDEYTVLYNDWSGGFIGRHLITQIQDQANYPSRGDKGIFQIIWVNQSGCGSEALNQFQPVNLTNFTKHFIVLSFNDTYSWNVYDNGVKIDSYNNHQEICGYSNYSYIGGYTQLTTRRGSSALDFFFMMNKSISDDEVRFLYEQTSGMGYQNILSNVSELYVYDLNYTSPIAESEKSNITLNLTYDDSLYIDATATLVYNGVEYIPTETENGNNSFFIKEVTAPSVSATTNVELYYMISLSNGTTVREFNTTFYNQTVNPISGFDVNSSLCNDRAYYFDFQDEQNFSLLNVDVQYNFKYGIGNGTLKTAYGNFTNVQNFSVCINSSASPTWTIGSGEIHYLKDGWVNRRFYIFDDTVIDNHTINHTLYSLLDTEQTSFQLVVEDTALNPYVDVYTATLRWYPQFNEYRIVEMGRTDDLGITVLHVETEDVDYRIAVYERDGTLLKLDTPTRMLCLVNPCTYTLRINPDETGLFDIFGIEYSLTFNETTKIVKFIYNDPSQSTTLMNMTVYQYHPEYDLIICNSYSTGFTGVFQCNLSSYSSGSFEAIVKRTDGIFYTIAKLPITISNSPFKSQWGLWITLLIAIPIVVFLTFISPIAGVIGIVISLIPAVYLQAFGSNTGVIYSAIIVLSFIVIHMIKRSKE